MSETTNTMNPILLATVSSLLTLISVSAGAYLNYKFGLRSQLKIGEVKNRQQAFGQLMGQKFMITQVYVSRFEALIYSDYHEIKWKLAGCPNESLDLQEAQRWMHKSEDLSLEIARNNQKLFEIIGFIKILFPVTTKLDELLDRIYHFRTPVVKTPDDKIDATQLEEWKKKAVAALQDLVKIEYAEPIDDLLDYLSKVMNK